MSHVKSSQVFSRAESLGKNYYMNVKDDVLMRIPKVEPRVHNSSDSHTSTSCVELSGNRIRGWLTSGDTRTVGPMWSSLSMHQVCMRM